MPSRKLPIYLKFRRASVETRPYERTLNERGDGNEKIFF